MLQYVSLPDYFLERDEVCIPLNFLCLGESTCCGLVPAINCLESWSFHLCVTHSSWGLVFLMALSVTLSFAFLQSVVLKQVLLITMVA